MLKVRILSGRFRGRTIQIPETPGVRPTTDRNREMLFNVLTHTCLKQTGSLTLTGLNVLDGFAGTGSFGLEALSRGASHVFFVEQNRALCKKLEALSISWEITQQVTLYQTTFSLLPKAAAPVDIVFLDPPYHQNLIFPSLEILEGGGWIGKNTWVILETEANASDLFLSKIKLGVHKVSGNSHFYFFQFSP